MPSSPFPSSPSPGTPVSFLKWVGRQRNFFCCRRGSSRGYLGRWGRGERSRNPFFRDFRGSRVVVVFGNGWSLGALVEKRLSFGCGCLGAIGGLVVSS